MKSELSKKAKGSKERDHTCRSGWDIQVIANSLFSIEKKEYGEELEEINAEKIG